jgi:hypothetical protein
VWISEKIDCGHNYSKFLLLKKVIMISGDLAKQEIEIIKAINKWLPKKCFIDSTNIGALIAGNLSSKFECCESIIMRETTKIKFIDYSKRLIERNTHIDTPNNCDETDNRYIAFLLSCNASKGDNEDMKSERFEFRCTKKEKETITDRAKTWGVPVSKFIIQRCAE